MKELGFSEISALPQLFIKNSSTGKIVSLLPKRWMVFLAWILANLKTFHGTIPQKFEAGRLHKKTFGA